MSPARGVAMNRTAGQVQARSERFTVGLSGAGKPMLRTLPEMDAGDVMDAVAFSARCGLARA